MKTVYLSTLARLLKNYGGYSPEELVGTKYIDLIIPEDVPKTKEVAANITAGIETRSFENRYRKKNGEIAYNLWSARWDPKLKIMYCVARDAKEKLIKESILIQSERRFKALVQEGSELTAILSEDIIFKYVTPSSVKVLGIKPDEFIGQFALDFVHPIDVERVLEDFESVKSKDKVKIEAFRFRNSEGEWRWMETVLTNMLNNPSVEGVIANARDVTDERKLKMLKKQANELAKLGSWEYDIVNDDLFWSDEVHRLHETDPETFVPTIDKAIKFYKKEHKASVRANIEKSINEGVYLDYEAVIISKSRKEKWIRVIGSPEFDKGKCVRFIGSFQDITERKEAESRLQSLSDNLPGVIFQYVIHPDGTDELKYVSKQSLNIWGISAEDAVASNKLIWNQIREGGDIDKVRNSIQESIANKSQWNAKWNYVMPKGEIRTHLGYGSPKFLADGTIYFNSMILDITKEIETERLFELAKSMARVGSWEYDFKNNKLTWSDMVHELHETDPRTFRPRLSTAIDFYREDFRELVQSNVRHCVETGEQVDFEAVIVTANNNERWVQSKGYSVFINGKCVKLYGSIQDIHDLKTAQINLLELTESLKKRTEDLEIKNEQLEQFAFIASHDLQEPLRMVSNFLELIKKKYTDKLDEKGRQYIQFATDGAKRMKDVIDGFLLYASLSEYAQQKEKVDLGKLVEDYSFLRKQLIIEKDAVIEVRSSCELNAFKTPLIQTINCLLDNAIHYSKEGVKPEIFVDCESRTEDWLISVEDNGIGIDSRFYDKVFDMFQRLQKVREEDGTGLGLAIAKKNVNSWDGEIWIDSEVQKGTTFYFTIPK